MRTYLFAGLIATLFAARSSAQTPPRVPPSLGGTSWQLVRFQGSDDKVLTPDDRAKYILAFGTDSSVSARIDCNRGRGTWTSSGPSQVRFGPLALTRAMCPPGSLHDRIVKDWAYVRSYVMKNGHLFLSLMADGGIYEFEPVAGAQSTAPRSPVPSAGPFTLVCTRTGGGSDTLRATFYQTEPRMVLVARRSGSRPAFAVPAGSGAKYEGDGIGFWEAHGVVASVTWSGEELTCRRP